MKVRLIFCPEWSQDGGKTAVTSSSSADWSRDGGKTAGTTSSTSADVEVANTQNKVKFVFEIFKIHKL